ncbi:zinc finger HIT domain-containing protein 3-like [Xenia sp. Carnegie-2017]|uniref:zinc finger HIT domain-containing protein 3-like n=1 Tax=Xenia sp. Carnegie-2017 TaxID=2897299 RepID=UPI001F0330BF|nr:zinc finger HIT domain-containing protein 3-like [Xenia sp. Carnegie-2017]
MKQCGVCKLTESKYRCPACRILYCSVGCYKTHKDLCCKQEFEEVVSCVEVEAKRPLGPDLEPGELCDDESKYDEDRISEEKLALLDKSQEVKDMLQNKHLRQLIMNINEQSDVADQLDAAMKLPVFAEFANVCLKLVDDRL